MDPLRCQSIVTMGADRQVPHSLTLGDLDASGAYPGHGHSQKGGAPSTKTWASFPRRRKLIVQAADDVIGGLLMHFRCGLANWERHPDQHECQRSHFQSCD